MGASLDSTRRPPDRFQGGFYPKLEVLDGNTDRPENHQKQQDQEQPPKALLHMHLPSSKRVAPILKSGMKNGSQFYIIKKVE